MYFVWGNAPFLLLLDTHETVPTAFVAASRCEGIDASSAASLERTWKPTDIEIKETYY